MCPVQERELLPEEMLCHRLIRRQHKIFDQLRRRIPLILFDLYGNTLFVEQDLCLREVKINRAALHPLLSEDTCELRHLMKHGSNFLILGCNFRILILNDLLYIRVCHPPVDMDHGLCDLIILHFSRLVNLHQTT